MKKIILFLTIMFAVATFSFGQAYPDRHSTSYKDAWVSCEEIESPNIKRAEGHWIMYDFGDLYSLHESTIWNFNVPELTTRGINNVVVDYSDDGEDWIELGEYNFNEAPGSSFYQGDIGPNFDGIVARYVLISVLSTHGDNDCAGMSEFRVNATIATSTNTINKQLDVTLSANPNPASDFTNIVLGETLQNLGYSLFDMNGKLLRQGKIIAKEFRLNTNGLASGAYTLNVHNSDGNKSIMINIINN